VGVQVHLHHDAAGVGHSVVQVVAHQLLVARVEPEPRRKSQLDVPQTHLSSARQLSLAKLSISLLVLPLSMFCNLEELGDMSSMIREERKGICKKKGRGEGEIY
jgi:hypothetical protein